MVVLAIDGGKPEVRGKIKAFSTIGKEEMRAALNAMDGNYLSGYLAGRDGGGVRKVRMYDVGQARQSGEVRAERLGEGGEVGTQRFLFEVAMVCGRDPADRHLRRNDLLHLCMDGIEPFVGEASCDDRHRIDIGAQRLMACRIEHIGDMATGICRHAEIDGRRLQTTAERQMYDDHERPFLLYRGSTTVRSICIQCETR